MKNWCQLVLIAVLMISGVSAAVDLEIEEIVKENVIVKEIGNSAYYDLIINNLAQEDQFRIFTLVGVEIDPPVYVNLTSGKTTVPIKATMSEKILRERSGFLSFEYQIKGLKRDLYKDKLLVKIVSLKDILEINYGNIHPDNNEVGIVVKNKEDVELDNLTLVFDSVFFRESVPLQLEPYENKTFSLPINFEGTKDLVAGSYIVETTIVANKESELEGIIDFLEKEGTSISENAEGILARTITITKTNEGNTPVIAGIETRKDIVSRLFTTTSPNPVQVNRDGFFVGYAWEKSLNPTDSLIVTTRTNYTVPFLILVLVIVVGVVVRVYYMGSVSINKRVSLVRTKGGEFALRVVLRVRARKTVDKLQLHDSLPGMTKLYENFGKQPNAIEKDQRRLTWNVGHLRRGEERVYSYVIYSRLNVVGRFELPLAYAKFEKDGRADESYSNRAYLAMEKS